MTAEDPAMLLQFFKALAHESRLRLLGLLATREHSVQELAAALTLKEPTVSHHLAMLRDTGLVRLRQDGNTHWYGLEQKTLSRMSRAMLARDQLEALAGAEIDTTDRAVRNYLNADGRLKSFPSGPKKRRPILVWLTRHFEEGRIYSEAEVNAIIETRHHDRESFRRELIGHQMLARKDGRYWRLPEDQWKRSPD
jgi:biotin operon repressor